MGTNKTLLNPAKEVYSNNFNINWQQARGRRTVQDLSGIDLKKKCQCMRIPLRERLIPFSR